MTTQQDWEERLEAATARNFIYKNHPGTSDETIRRSDSTMTEASGHLPQSVAAAARERGNRRGFKALGHKITLTIFR